ncbi:hypothetical protein VTN77DRAFT_1810 [Rasamsonia byssochlamydoides]|uniref:uncharacterized protein n=1 Tax=Rasamsonia byssochlamydoides TaxID=89139 RepID=UPI0037430819
MASQPGPDHSWLRERLLGFGPNEGVGRLGRLGRGRAAGGQVSGMRMASPSVFVHGILLPVSALSLRQATARPAGGCSAGSNLEGRWWARSAIGQNAGIMALARRPKWGQEGFGGSGMADVPEAA